MNSIISWDNLSFIILFSLLWIIIRYFIDNFQDILQLFYFKDNIQVDIWNNNVYYPVSYWTEKGGRPYQEDRHHEIKGVGKVDSSIYGLFDGHSGCRASQYCRDHLLQSIVDDKDFINSPIIALKNAFIKTNTDFSNIARLKSFSDGTTAIVAVVHDNRVYVANVGDSRSILVQKGGKARPMSYDHTPNRMDEQERITKLGGKVIFYGRWRVQGTLAVSRAIGDVSLQPYVIGDPEIYEKSITSDDEYLVLASDGLWDVLSNDKVAEIVFKSNDFINIAKELCQEALQLGSLDNVTALVVDLKRRPYNETTKQR